MAIKFFIKTKKQKGYALLFTLVVVSIMVAMSAGVSSSISKQMILSSTAHDSQIAFYEADTGAECALYAYSKGGGFILSGAPYNGKFDCGLNDQNNLVTLDVVETFSGSQVYKFTPPSSQKGTCAKFELDQSGGPTAVTAQVYGYNICDSKTKRSVERGIDLTFF